MSTVQSCPEVIVWLSPFIIKAISSLLAYPKGNLSDLILNNCKGISPDIPSNLILNSKGIIAFLSNVVFSL